MDKSIAIIGAGIAGLAAGCYAQMNGYQSHIFELHALPGGLCTAWERKGYTFDGCLHYLLGSAPGQPFHQVWQELGAMQDRFMINHEELMRIVGPGGQTLVGYCDPQRLADHIKQLSPADAELADDLAEGIRDFLSFDMSVLQSQASFADEWNGKSRTRQAYAALYAPAHTLGRRLERGIRPALRQPIFTLCLSLPVWLA